MNILLHGWSDKVFSQSCQCFCNSHVAAGGGAMEFSEDRGYGLEALREDEVMTNGIVWVFLRVGLNAPTKLEEVGVVKEFPFEFLQKQKVGYC